MAVLWVLYLCIGPIKSTLEGPPALPNNVHLCLQVKLHHYLSQTIQLPSSPISSRAIGKSNLSSTDMAYPFKIIISHGTATCQEKFTLR